MKARHFVEAGHGADKVVIDLQFLQSRHTDSIDALKKVDVIVLQVDFFEG